MTSADWIPWFHRMELLARLGVAGSFPEFQRQVKELSGLSGTGKAWFTNGLSPGYFKRWGFYTGWVLEGNWKTAQRRQFDLTFKSLLIMNYSRALSMMN